MRSVPGPNPAVLCYAAGAERRTMLRIGGNAVTRNAVTALPAATRVGPAAVMMVIMMATMAIIMMYTVVFVVMMMGMPTIGALRG